MSRKVEQAMGGLVQSLLGSLGGNGNTLFGGTGPPSTQPSLGFLAFVEKAQQARKQSREAECSFFATSAASWQSELSRPAVSPTATAAVLQRAMVAACRGYAFPALHIHAVNLTQAGTLLHKRMGYLYLSVIASSSTLSLLVSNTLYRDASSSDAVVLLAALTTLPRVLAGEAPPAPHLLRALTACLHHPMSLVRRKACQVLYAGATVWRGDEHEDHGDTSARGVDGHVRSNNVFLEALLCSGDVVPPLLQLLADRDPSVALAATEALAQLYKHFSQLLSSLRAPLACGAAYLLSRALEGALPPHYGSAPLHAPHVQLHAIRVLHIVCVGGDDPCWRPPPEVESSLTPVLTQVWGSGGTSLCMVLLEAALLALQLPHTTTTMHGLRSTAAHVLLGFLKSSDGRLQYSAVQMLCQYWTSVSTAVTPAHLHAVVHNLHTSTCPVLVHSTLHLLCTMANEHNYKSVVHTLHQYCSSSSTFLRSTILHRLAALLRYHATDAAWCVEELSSLVVETESPELAQALVDLIVKELQMGSSTVVPSSLSLLTASLSPHTPTRTALHRQLVAPILAHLNDSLASVEIQSVGSRPVKDESASSGNASHSDGCLDDGKAGVSESVIGDYCPVLSSEERTALLEINEAFVNQIYLSNECTNEDALCVFECLKKIGLCNSHLRHKIVQLLVDVEKSSDDVVHRLNAREVLLWLENDQLAMQVVRTQRDIFRSSDVIDWTLPFLEDFINESLEKGNEKLHLFLDVAVVKEKVPCAEQKQETDIKNSETVSSCYSTPCLSLQEGAIGKPPTRSSFQRSDSIKIKSRDHLTLQNIPYTNNSVASGSSQHVVPSLSLFPEICNGVPGSHIGVGSNRAQPLSSSPPSSLPLGSDYEELSSAAASARDGAATVTSLLSPRKLFWSVEGRSPDSASYSSSFELSAPSAEGIEFGAEACEELLLDETGSVFERDHIPATAAALAKVLYAGLTKK